MISFLFQKLLVIFFITRSIYDVSRSHYMICAHSLSPLFNSRFCRWTLVSRFYWS